MTLAISLTGSPEFDVVVDASALRFQWAHLILDSSYPLGGYPVSPSRFGFSSTGRILDVVSTGFSVRKLSYATGFDPINKTLRVFSVPSGVGAWVEVIATTSLAGTVIRAVVIGY